MKTILITGCSSGFGLEIARYFLAQGWRVVATMRTPRMDLLPISEHLKILPMNVTDPLSIRAAIEAAGPIDVLVNNAGIGMVGPVERVLMQTVREVFETNVLGMMPYHSLASSHYVKPSTQQTRRDIFYHHGAGQPWQQYTHAMMAPVEIYQGSDSQFEEFTTEEKQELAAYMQAQFMQQLGTRFQFTQSPAPNTLYIKLTLTGASKTSRLPAMATHIAPFGAVYNGVQSARGAEGSFTGSVLYATEVYDATTAQLLDAQIVKQHPGAYHLGSAFGNALAAAKVGVEQGAKSFAAQFASTSPTAAPMDAAR
ncbi:MAG: hypothetical protein DI582_08200 [Azospirillum brasilense]|nr:MAG: hypothetical protein DI582_08200 [Azospirillum brasilense]